MFAKILSYFRSVYSELFKVSWPKRNQVIYLTIVVIISVGVAMALVALIDWGLSKIVHYFIYR